MQCHYIYNVCIFAPENDKILHPSMKTLLQYVPTLALEILLGLLVLIGIVLFVKACWRNLKRHDDD